MGYVSLDDDGISLPTAKSWLSILITTELVYLLEPYMTSELKRLTHIPKIIFMNTGLACFLAGWTSREELQNSSNAGHYLENFIVSEIIKSYNSKSKKIGQGGIIYFYDDLIKLDENNYIIPISSVINPR